MSAGAQQQLVNTLDRAAMGLSAVCIVHCLAGALMLAVAASVAAPFLNPLWHEVGLIAAAVIGVAALGRGFMLHGRRRPALLGSVGIAVMTGALVTGHEADGFAIAGALGLALAHWLNSRALH